jgi:hypothetical protein
MHTTTLHGSTALILHHGDYQGDVTIRDSADRTVHVPADLLRQFVANQVRGEQIGRLESLSTNEILGLVRPC